MMITALSGQCLARTIHGGHADSKIRHLVPSTWIHSPPHEPAHLWRYSNALLFGLHRSSIRTAILN